MSPSNTEVHSMTAAMKRVFEEEIRNSRSYPSVRQWLEAKADAPHARGCPDCGGSGRDIRDWSHPCWTCGPMHGGRARLNSGLNSGLNSYDAQAIGVLRVLLETDVLIINPGMQGLIDSESCENQRPNWSLHHDALWVISFASCIETRELQVIATSWGNRHYPRPGQHYRGSPVVILIADRSITDWLSEFTY